MKLSSSCGRITIKIEVYCVQLINDCPQPPFLICVDRDAGIARHSGEILWHEIPESKSKTNLNENEEFSSQGVPPHKIFLISVKQKITCLTAALCPPLALLVILVLLQPAVQRQGPHEQK